MSVSSLDRSLDNQWLLLSLFPRFATRARERVLANADCLTDVLSMNPATLKALGLSAETMSAIHGWQT